MTGAEAPRRPVDATTRRFLLQTRAAMTVRAGRDLKSLCLDPRWLLTSIANLPLLQVAQDLRRGGDPDLRRLAKTMEQASHLLGGATSKRHRINSVLLWLAADPRLQAVVQCCHTALKQTHLQLLWSVHPTSIERSHTLKRHSSHVVSCTFSSDDQQLITVDQMGNVILWDVASGALVAQIGVERAVVELLSSGMLTQPHRGRIRASFVPEQTRLLAGGDNQLAVLTSNGILAIWSLGSLDGPATPPSPTCVLDTSANDPDAATFLVPVGRSTFMTRSDESFRLRDWEDGRVLLTIPLDGQLAAAHIDAVNGLLAAESAPDRVDVWDLEGRRRVGHMPIRETGEGISDIAVNGSAVFVVDHSGFGTVWNWEHQRRIDTTTGIFGLPQLDTSAGVFRWLRHPGELTVAPLASAGGIKAHTGRRRAPSDRPDHDEYGRAVDVLVADGLLATVVDREVSAGGDALAHEHRVDMFDLSTGRSMANGWGADATIKVARGPKSGQLIVVTSGGTVETWDPASNGVRFAHTSASGRPTVAAAVSADGQTVAVTDRDIVHLIQPSETDETPSGRDSAQSTPYPLIGTILDALADPRGRWLATLTHQLELDVWDPRTGELLHRCPGRAPMEFRNSLAHMRAFSPDGRWIAVNDLDNSLLLWDPFTGQLVGGMPSQSADLVHAATSPHGPIVVLRHRDQRLTVWDVARQQQLAALPPVRSAVVGDNAGRWIAWLDEESRVQIWNTALGLASRSPGVADGIATDRFGQHLYVWDSGQVRVVDSMTGQRTVLWDSGIGPPRALPPISRFLVSDASGTCVRVHGDGLVHLLDANSQGTDAGGWALGGQVTMTPEIGLAMALSPAGRYLAATDGQTGRLEVIHLTCRHDVVRRQASATFDGSIHRMVWIVEGVLAVAGDFGVQTVALATAA